MMNIRILIADDSTIMRKMISNVLKNMGIEPQNISEAVDGLQAVEMAKKNKFDLILMDWNMPYMLGVDAVRAIRTLGVRTPILMVTTEGEKQNVVAAIQAGANNFVIKPFQASDLESRIGQLLAA